MEKKIKKGNQANYEIELVVTTEEQDKAAQRILKEFQKDLSLPGFRKGFVPMNLVQENIRPEYLTIGTFENLINKGLQELIKEQPEMRFIGEPYDIGQEKKGEDLIVKLKLDIFPEVEVKNDSWKKQSIKEIEVSTNNQEIEEALVRLQKNYADYQDADTISEDTVSKVELIFVDAKDNETDKGHCYVGEQEFAEFPFFKKTFLGKKKNETIEIAYKEKDLPPTLHTKKPDAKPTTIKATIKDIKKVILPEINEDTIKKLFGPESTLKSVDEVKNYIEEVMNQQKFEQTLMQEVENYLNTIRKDHMSIAIPKTLLDEELKVRMQSLEKRFGNKERMDQYLQQMGEEKAKTFTEDIRNAAQESLEKFFMLQKIAELLELQINRQQPGHLEIEKKLYEKIIGGSSKTNKDETPKATKPATKKTKKE